MKPSSWLCLALSAALGLVLVCGEVAATNESRGLQIATDVDHRDTGFGDLSAKLTMTLYSDGGESNVRRMRARILETESGDKRVIQFDEPGDVRGTAVLTHTHDDGADDQWIYLPSLKRVKRIATGAKTGPFMGSEFSYEDLTAQALAKYTYEYVRDEACGGGNACFVIQRIPTTTESGYRRQLVWIDEQEFRVWRVEYYDRKDTLLKVLTFDKYALHKDRFWRAGVMTMQNVQTGKRTVLDWTDYEFGTGLTEAAFDPAQLSDLH